MSFKRHCDFCDTDSSVLGPSVVITGPVKDKKLRINLSFQVGDGSADLCIPCLREALRQAAIGNFEIKY